MQSRTKEPRRIPSSSTSKCSSPESMRSPIVTRKPACASSSEAKVRNVSSKASRFDMEEGDFLTNPNWTWHEHVNNSNQPVLWIDALDSPLMRFLEVGFHEPHESGKQAVSKSEGTTLRRVKFDPSNLGTSRIRFILPAIVIAGRRPKRR